MGIALHGPSGGGWKVYWRRAEEVKGVEPDLRIMR
jgi:hypothetical protein